MFNVIAKRSGSKYVVYSVREQEGAIQFLLYRGRWIWVDADDFEPVDGSIPITEVEEKYKMW